MPFLRVDAYEGRSKEQVKEVLDAIHRAILSAFEPAVSERDCVAIVSSKTRCKARLIFSARRTSESLFFRTVGSTWVWGGRCDPLERNKTSRPH